MILFPAIDIKDGKCVRLTQGDYNKEKIYNDSPVEVASDWEKLRASYLHIVDLDGAKTGISVNRETIQAIAGRVSIPLQLGGGIRSMSIIEEYITAGVSRVIIGTAAINDKTFLKEAIDAYASKIAVSIDARNGYAATNGWLETSTVKAIELVKELESLGVETIIYTDILKDGMLQGPNFKELKEINEATSMNVIASGGISTAVDVEKLKSLDLYGAIIGKALYDGTLEFEELLDGEDNAR